VNGWITRFAIKYKKLRIYVVAAVAARRQVSFVHRESILARLCETTKQQQIKSKTLATRYNIVRLNEILPYHENNFGNKVHSNMALCRREINESHKGSK
jgi:predicted PolB exonuclease-like 3'-5' exonuclease